MAQSGGTQIALREVELYTCMNVLPFIFETTPNVSD